MIVNELIAELLKMPPTARVIALTDMGECNIESVDIEDDGSVTISVK